MRKGTSDTVFLELCLRGGLVMLALRMQNQEDLEFKTSLSYI